MSDYVVLSLAQEWHHAIVLYSDKVRAVVKEIAIAHKKDLANSFYEQMLTNKTATLFLSHEAVQNRLMHSMQNWIEQLFSVDAEADFVELVELQKKIGAVHARIDLPVYLVLYGARMLKNKFNNLLDHRDDLDIEVKSSVFKLFSDSLDIAMEIMSHAYARNYDRQSRAEESYRLFSAVHNVAAEKGKQYSALLDWENQLMFDLTIDASVSNLIDLSGSNFGLWFFHKGLHVFENLKETVIITDSIRRIDNLLPSLLDKEKRVSVLKEIRIETRNIKLNVDVLFDKYSELESGRDELTKLLSRKYLSVILSKEVSYARKRGIDFALVAVDIDYFKSINDTYGHDAGDAVLQQLAELLSNRSRAGDYVFRLGGEEFLILLVDVRDNAAVSIANKINQEIKDEDFVLPNKKQINITASLGVTLYDGHPDYSRTLSQADKALYQAKNTGRDKVVYLEPSYV